MNSVVISLKFLYEKLFENLLCFEN